MSDISMKKVRQFYWIVGAALSVYAVIAWRHGHLTRGKVMVGVALTLLCLHYLLPAVSLVLFQANQKLLSKIGSVLTKLFLIIFFYAIFTPYGLLIRLFQKDPLRRKYEPQRISYWINRTPSEAQDKSCENPF
jgi:hypothetical protein